VSVGTRGLGGRLGSAAYNRAMLHSLNARMSEIVAPALAERLTLLINHVLSAEPAATARLQPHAGAVLALALPNWPALLPPPPALAWRVTPAGLLDWCGTAPLATSPTLQVSLDASNPAWLMAQALAGEQPKVQIEGDAQLAGDVNWLLQNLRWDVTADLERLFGPTVAGPLHQFGRMLAGGLGKALEGAASLGDKLRPRRV
jgi:ubiquinone biosynthesis accessory factor UbiJ